MPSATEHRLMHTWKTLHRPAHTPADMPPAPCTHTLQGSHGSYTHTKLCPQPRRPPSCVEIQTQIHVYLGNVPHTLARKHTNAHPHQGIHTMHTYTQTHLRKHTPRTHTGLDIDTHFYIENTTETCTHTHSREHSAQRVTHVQTPQRHSIEEAGWDRLVHTL